MHYYSPGPVPGAARQGAAPGTELDATLAKKKQDSQSTCLLTTIRNRLFPLPGSVASVCIRLTTRGVSLLQETNEFRFSVYKFNLICKIHHNVIESCLITPQPPFQQNIVDPPKLFDERLM